jgi:2,4-dienoyl-CoA reductase-like NADH-dependent reductase (Old Yellow Enzyme family)
MSIIFQPGRIGNLEIKNRIVRSATYEGMGTAQGEVTDGLVRMNEDLAKGEVGLIVAGFSYVMSNGRGAPYMTAICSDDYIAGFNQIAERVHAAGGKICAQIAHCGRKTRPEIIGGETPMGPSPIPFTTTNITPREMTKDDIDEVVGAFAQAARRVKDAGFDAVQLHSAHGYLLSAFISPYANRRTDEYGGSVENRARMLLEVYRAVRDTVGSSFPILIKINADDLLDGGLTIDQSAKIAGWLAEEGIDAIEISAGGAEGNTRSARTEIKTPEQEAYLLPYALEFRKQVGSVPLILVGGMRSPEVVEKVLEEGGADFASICRPLIWEPHLIKRWMEGDREKARCISCNLCYSDVWRGPTYCHVLKKQSEQQTD